MIEKIDKFLQGNTVAFSVILVGAILVLLRHEEAGKAVITGGCVHLKQ